MIDTIFPIAAFNDNYIWAWVDEVKKSAIIVDPGDAVPVLTFLDQKYLTLKAILVTHRHYDHIGGISKLLSVFPEALVFSHKDEQIEQTTQFVLNNDVIHIDQYEFRVIAIPGHTLGHVAYYSKPALFCGDTLFTNGCGRIFEGTVEQMFLSLKALMMLPDDTQIYCGHEYTLANIKFSLLVDPHNIALQKRLIDVKKMRSENKPTVPSSLKLEKETNPFLRCTDPSIVNNVSHYAKKQLNSEVDIFSELRQWKNVF